MITPKMQEYDGWRNSAVGIWFFETFLQSYADEAARQNGKAPGSYQSQWEDFAAYVRNAGYISGVEYTITIDPFEETRHEIESHREVPTGTD